MAHMRYQHGVGICASPYASCFGVRPGWWPQLPCDELVPFAVGPAHPGCSRVAVGQALRTDRAAFVKIAELVHSVKPLDGTKPLDAAFASVLGNVSVSFDLLPLVQPAPPIKIPKNKRSLKPGNLQGLRFSISPKRNQVS